MPIGGAEFRDENQLCIHGKNTFQDGVRGPEHVPAGGLVRIHQSFELLVAAGRYSISLGLVDSSPEIWRRYMDGQLPYEEFAARLRVICRVVNAAWITVMRPVDRTLPHHGLADLPGTAAISVAPGRVAAIQRPVAASPTLLHVTHWKAGSQWLHGILRESAPGRVIEPQPGEVQVRYSPIQPGTVYPAVYLSRQELAQVALPPNTKVFVVIRDLRDTLVSAYYSFKISHPILGPEHVELRALLQEMDEEDGLMYLIENSIPACARIQLSWIESDVPLLRYEDLLRDDVGTLTELLIERFRMPIGIDRLRQVVEANRFEVRSGRARGSEDTASHARKGIAGDWRNHFTDRLKKAFKTRFGGLLVATGYERDLAW